MQPSELQSKASGPNYSVWVSASAGSGKTKVLTDRVLRLLLAGTPPSKILCITYTKAGAAEMRARIEKRLGDWVMMKEAALVAELAALTGAEIARREELALARQLFARVIEDAVGLRIQTIHAFCQSLLARFPVEANVPPHFRLIEDEAAAHLLEETKFRLANGGMGADAPDDLIKAIKKMARSGSEMGFDDLLATLVQRRREFGALQYSNSSHRLRGEIGRRESGISSDDVPLFPHPNREGAIYALCGVPEGIGDMVDFRAWCALSPQQLQDLKALCGYAAGGSANDVKCHKILSKFLSAENPALEDYAALLKAFFTEKGTLRDKILTAGLVKKHPPAEASLARLLGRMEEIKRVWSAFRTAERSEATQVIARHLYDSYARLKQARAALDYDDLIFKARQLLTSEQALGWVMFKLDGGIDHVLVDESQDTSRDQWEITAALTDEFFTGFGARETVRTLFVVGDAKQSIFRFQGAYPEGFFEFRTYFTRKAHIAGMAFHLVPMTTSFRSSPAILNLVDSVFAQDGTRVGLGEDYAAHAAYHAALPGKVELWPVFTSDRREAVAAWHVPTEPRERTRGEARLAEEIAKTIAGWLREKRILPATGNAIQPQDIMILSKRREPMASALLGALRKYGVPSSGLDRLALTEDIAVKDMLALGQFLLLPADDLSLAALLKSPLFEVSEEILFTLCYGRDNESVWQRVQAYQGPEEQVHAARNELRALLDKTDFVSPYTLFADVLQARGGMCKMAARLGEHVKEVLEAFLNEALRYENNETPSLQGFCHWLAQSGREVKREQEQQSAEVRVLTVHGAKGLEAPIVFLADTTQLPDLKAGDRLIADAESGLIIALPTQAEEIPLTAELRAEAERLAVEEYHRLLYVALTRAKYELYVTGVLNANQKQVKEGSWYDAVAQGLERLPHRKLAAAWDGEIVIYEEEGSAIVAGAHENAASGHAPLPAYFRHDPVKEPMKTILNPSHLDDEAEEAALFSVFSMEERKARVERGNVIHRLLEVLTEVKPEKRLGTGLKIAARHAPHRIESERREWVESVIKLMENPEYKAFFGASALVEAPVAGTLKDGRHVAGQIDRLVVSEDTVEIIDFKTGKHDKNQPVPKKYRAQMQAYMDLLGQIYPDKKVRGGLLFTETPEIKWIEN